MLPEFRTDVKIYDSLRILKGFQTIRTKAVIVFADDHHQFLFVDTNGFAPAVLISRAGKRLAAGRTYFSISL